MKCSKVLSLVVLAAIVIVPQAQASTLQEQLTQYQQDYNQYNNQYAQQKQQESSSQSRIKGLQQSINNLKNGLASDKANIAKQQQDLQALNQKQKELEAKRQIRIKEFDGFLRTNYETDPFTYIGVLLNANSWSDLLNKVNSTTYFINHFDQLQGEIKSLSKQIDAQKEDMQKKTTALQTTIQQKEATQASIQLSMTTEQQLLSQLTAQQKATLANSSKAQSQIAYVQDMIHQQELEAEYARQHPINNSDNPGVSTITTPVPLTGTIGELIAYAESFTGTPYVWGGTSPSGFDCSGFTQYVFKHFGISLPRVSQDQYQVGIPVSSDQLQPGDLVFFSTYAAGATHVGIYVGNESMVNAEGYGVMVTNIFSNAYWGPRYIGARRVIK